MNDETRLSSSEDVTVMSKSDDVTMLSARSGSASSSWSNWPSDQQRLEPGQTFGPYVIGPMLGRGGMGEVYEAEDVESGRRVALKLLRGRIDQGEDRARFLSEGRLAASISHPHTVYIFGSEEIDGMPVISMQLLPGGTLKDRVVDGGPMSPSDAVSAILDVVSGLDAASAAGILHRDIKPSNCFVDHDGNVKVGDFGLSISTSARDARHVSSGFQGTPQYAPPEQLRGEPLDVRADVYAVGATLFYLLTGRAPFEAQEFAALVEAVKNAPAPLAHKVRPGIPPKLSAVIVKCLAKNAADRPASYADLVAMLRPFSGETTPARRGIRLIAGAIDLMLLSVPAMFLQAATVQVVRGRTTASVDTSFWPLALGVLYFGLCESLWGTTAGKRLCGLRVVSTSGELTWRQAFGRALIFYGPRIPVVLLGILNGITPVVDVLTAHPVAGGIVGAMPIVLSVLLFVTMRRANGLATVHDLWTGTRVVQRKPRELRRGSAAADAETSALAPVDSARRRFGTFEVVGSVAVASGRVLEAIDTVLARRVWIVEAEPGAPDVSRARRDVDRVGRLHWLAGKRSADENWDAFEAPQGALANPSPGGSPWSSVKGWLNDVVTELAAAQRDGTQPPLSLDRLWIRSDGRAVLVDGLENRIGSYSEITPDPISAFLVSIGRLAFGNSGSPMPVSAVAMLDRWERKGEALTIAEARADLDVVLMSPDEVSRRRRLTPLLLSAAPVALAVVISIVAVRTMRQTLSPETFQMIELLGDLDKEVLPERKTAIEIYLAGRLRPQLEDEAIWKTMISKDDDREIARLRALAARALERRPTPDELARATAALQSEVDKAGRKWDGQSNTDVVIIALLLIGAGSAFFSSVVSVIVRPSGVLMSALGLAVLVRSGREVSRPRAVLRLLVAWSPMLAYAALLSVPWTRPYAKGALVPAVAVALQLAGAVWTIARPTRGPHDSVMRTRIGVR